MGPPRRCAPHRIAAKGEPHGQQQNEPRSNARAVECNNAPEPVEVREEWPSMFASAPTAI
jgi:hypothetical protein